MESQDIFCILYTVDTDELFLPVTVNNLFKFQAQDSDLEYLFWSSEKKPPLVISKKNSRSLEQFFLTEGQNKIHFRF